MYFHHSQQITGHISPGHGDRSSGNAAGIQAWILWATCVFRICSGITLCISFLFDDGSIFSFIFRRTTELVMSSLTSMAVLCLRPSSKPRTDSQRDSYLSKVMVKGPLLWFSCQNLPQAPYSTPVTNRAHQRDHKDQVALQTEPAEEVSLPLSLTQMWLHFRWPGKEVRAVRLNMVIIVSKVTWMLSLCFFTQQ